MKYTQLKAFEKHLHSSSPNHFSQVYCLIIKDSGEKALVLDVLKKMLGVSQFFHYSSDAKQEQAFLSDLDAPSLFQEAQIFHFHAVDKLQKGSLEILEKKLQHLPKGTTVILSGEAMPRNTSFSKTLEKVGVTLEMKEEKAYEKEKGCTEWLLERSALAKKTLKSEAATLLVRGTQGSLALLSGEWEKLLLYVGDRPSITEQDVQAIARLDVVDSSWLLGEAVLQMNGKLALEVVTRALNQGASVFPLLRQLRHQMKTALQLATASLEGKNEIISVKFPYLKGQMLEKQLAIALRYGVPRLAKGISLIDHFEFKAKDTWDDPRLLLNILITRLT